MLVLARLRGFDPRKTLVSILMRFDKCLQLLDYIDLLRLETAVVKTN